MHVWRKKKKAGGLREHFRSMAALKPVEKPKPTRYSQLIHKEFTGLKGDFRFQPICKRVLSFDLSTISEIPPFTFSRSVVIF